MKQSTPSNALGDFYVAKDECVSCGAPEAEAPDLMEFDEVATSCFFNRQPASMQELDQAVRAVQISCCRAVRYRGSDATVQERLAQTGDIDAIDVPLARLVAAHSGRRY